MLAPPYLLEAAKKRTYPSIDRLEAILHDKSVDALRICPCPATLYLEFRPKVRYLHFRHVFEVLYRGDWDPREDGGIYEKEEACCVFGECRPNEVVF